MKRAILLCSLSIAACQSPTPAPGIQLLVATSDLPAGHVLVAEDLQPAELPTTHATPGAARPGDRDTLLGQQLRVPLVRGGTVLRTATRTPERTLRPGEILEKRRALTLPLAGAKEIGESPVVDLVFELEKVAAPNAEANEAVTDGRIQRRIRQLRVLGRLPPVTADQPTRLTLEMLPEEAEIVAQAMEVGTLRVEASGSSAAVARQ